MLIQSHPSFLSFNTSHVTLYRRKIRKLLRENGSFNTSHVTLYHAISDNQALYFLVSIHLMLLFIGEPDTLSAILFSFNTSHVTLYLKAGDGK